MIDSCLFSILVHKQYKRIQIHISKWKCMKNLSPLKQKARSGQAVQHFFCTIWNIYQCFGNKFLQKPTQQGRKTLKNSQRFCEILFICYYELR
jgi:hypothetical protein